MLAKLSRLTLEPWKVSTARGSSRESIIKGWLYLRSDEVIGLIESLSCRLEWEWEKLVTMGGGYWTSLSAECPSRPALLMVLVFRVMPDEPPTSAWSSWRCLRFRQRKNTTAPTMARRTARPPTTPPTIAPVLEPLPLLPVLDGAEVGETTMVRVITAPLSVITE